MTKTVNELPGTPSLYKEVLRSDWDKAQLELAARRAQQPGVVLPPSPYMPGADPDQMTDYERGEAQGRCDMWAEVKRLNASPVSAPAALPDDFVCDSKPLQDLLNATAMLLETPSPDSATYWGAMLANVEALLNPASAGGVDERAVDDSEMAGVLAMAKYTQYRSLGYTPEKSMREVLRTAKRAALTASAQSVPDGYALVPKVASLAMKNAGWQEIARQGIDPESCEMQTIYCAMLAAAPAPGKGGDSV